MTLRSKIINLLEESAYRSKVALLLFVSFLGMALITLGIIVSKVTWEEEEKVLAIESWAMDTDLSTADASFIGESNNDYSGYYVANAGDVNGDGYDDVLIGAYGNDDGGSEIGQAYLILGKASSWSMDTALSGADASFIGEDAGDRAGISVAGAGDVNKDGYDDIVIGAYWDEDGGTRAGQTYLILGKASGWSMDTSLSASDASFIGEADIDWSGYVVAGAGDVNGDGYDDVLIGADLNDEGGSCAGQTYLILGKASGWSMDTDLSAVDASFIGEDIDDYSGHAVAAAGDVNGDGYDDILIGAYGDDDGGSGAGQVYLILGKASGWSMDTVLSSVDASFWGEDSLDHIGTDVAGAGDVNGDGYDDIIIGAEDDEEGGSNAGQTYLILGKASGWSMDTNLSTADASFIGEEGGDTSGESISGAGDVNGDGYDDFIIGAWANDETGSNAGQTYLILGKASGWSMDTDLSAADASFLGEGDDEYSADGIAGGGDINGDGYDDFIIGAYGSEEGYCNGQTYLIFAPTYLINNLTSSLTALRTSNWSTDVSSVGQVGTYEIGIKKGSYRIAVLSIAFTEDRDWSSVVADVDNQKALFYHPGGFSSIPGATGSGFSLYVPIPSGAQSDSVILCPSATSLPEVSQACTGALAKTTSDSDTSKVTIGGQLYWRVDNLTSTGGISISEDEDDGDGDEDDQGEDNDRDLDGMRNDWEDQYWCVDTNLADAYRDVDKDWLYNVDEYLNNTDPCDEDTDDGGVIDGAEISKGTDPNFGADDYWSDSDHDGLSDATEGYMCTDPFKSDTDGDGYKDGEEVEKGTDPCDENDPEEGVDFGSLPETGAYDSDGDGLSDGVENQIGTDKNNPDKDGDGLLDGEEVEMYGTDPLKADSDSDGVTDYNEVNSSYGEGRKSDPDNADSDGDGYKDGEEDLNGNGKMDEGESDPTDANSVPQTQIGSVERLLDKLYPYRLVFIIGGVMCFVLLGLLLIFLLLKRKEEEDEEGKKGSKKKLPQLRAKRKGGEFKKSISKGTKKGLPRSPLADIETATKPRKKS